MSDYGMAPTRGDIPSLTGLRIVAAFWVVMLHLQIMFALELPEMHLIRGWTRCAYVAVDLFFVISGYVISHSYMPRRAIGNVNIAEFYVRRLARIYPVHIFMLMIFMLFIVAARQVGVSPANPGYFKVSGAIEDIFLVRGWISPSLGWNFPAWSLSAEWFSYLISPLMFWAMLRFTNLRRRSLLAILLLSACFLGGFFALVEPSIDGMPAPLVRVILGFGAGVVLHRLMTTYSWHRPTMGWVAVAGLFTMMVVIPLISLNSVRAALALGAGIAMVGGLAVGRGPFNTMLCTRAMQYGGKISFSLYMTHAFFDITVLQVLKRSHVTSWPTVARVLLLVLTVVAVFAVAALVYHYIEKKGHQVVMKMYRHVASAPVRRMERIEN